MFRPQDRIEALERMDTDAGHFEPGDRRTVRHVSASGFYIQLVGADAFIPAHGWRRVKADDWSNGSNIRFRVGKPQVIGGWEA